MDDKKRECATLLESWLLCWITRTKNSFFSEEHKRKLSEANLRRDPEIYRRAGQSQRGKIVSEETRRKLSENQRRRGSTQEFKLLNSKIHKGRRIMNNGEIEIHVKPCDIENRIKEGFKFESLRRTKQWIILIR